MANMDGQTGGGERMDRLSPIYP